MRHLKIEYGNNERFYLYGLEITNVYAGLILGTHCSCRRKRSWVLDYFGDEGLAENTLVVIHLGSRVFTFRGTRCSTKRFMYDESFKTP